MLATSSSLLFHAPYGLQNTKMAKVISLFLIFIVVAVTVESVFAKPQVHRVRKRRTNTSIVDFIRRSMRKYGEKEVQAAFEALDGKDITQVIQILIGQTDKQVADDIIAMQQYAAQNDPVLVTMIRKVYSSESVPPKEMFQMDDKLKIYPWWRRLRGRIITNVDKYIAIFINNMVKNAATPTTTTVKATPAAA